MTLPSAMSLSGMTTKLFRQAAPVSTVFMFHGLVLGAWATQVPLLRERLALSPGALGSALFCASAGAVLAMPGTSRLVARFGPGLVIRVAALVACSCFLLAAAAPGYAALCASLAVFGMGYGTVDVAMNAESVQVELQAGRKLLGAVHAMWSFGSFAGSAGGAALLALLPPWAQAAGLAALSWGAIAFASLRLGASRATGEDMLPSTHRPWRDRTLVLTGLLLCVAFAVEGAVADWGGVYLRGVRHVSPPLAAIGYSAFSLCMVTMRLAGDRLRARFGDTHALLGGFVAAAGIVCVVAAPSLPLAVAGFALAGLGTANTVPALFALAGARGGADANAAVGVVATLGYAGVLAGPPLFGFVAGATSLPAAIGLIGVLCCGVGLAGLGRRR